jgi:hypothetical protein
VPSTVPRRGELTRASLLCCGLFILEDPGIIAARRALSDVWTGTTSGIAIDAVLGVTMIGYNYAASRYVVSVGEASSIDAAMRRLAELRIAALEAERRRTRRVTRRVLRQLNPFNLIKAAAEGFGRVLDQMRSRANQRALASVAELMGELAAVNVLGVPGAALESVARRERVDSRRSLRHAVLFVASWFAGARLLGIVLDALYGIPAAGDGIAATTSAIGSSFDTLTDVRHPAGAIAIVVVTASLIRYTRTVERTAASIH